MIGEDNWVRLTDFPARDEAARAGAMLLESGIVATLDDGAVGDEGDVGEVDAVSAVSPVSLSVQADDVARACELLGVAEPLAPVLPLDQPIPAESTRWRLPRERLGLFIVGYIVVLAALCVAVFIVVVWILGGYGSTEVPSVTSP